MINDDNEQLAWQAMEAGNYVEAIPLLNALAERNSEYALLSLGWIYDAGKVGQRNAELAAFYYSKAAELGIASGFFELGRLQYREEKLTEARALFHQGSQLGSIQCLAWLGLMSTRGEGGEKDTEYGKYILRISADAGQLVAKRELCRIQLESADSIFSRAVIYIKILWIAILVFVDTLKDPYSERGYR